MLRIYVSSLEKDNVSPEDVITLSETSSDFEATEDRPEKVIYQTFVLSNHIVLEFISRIL